LYWKTCKDWRLYHAYEHTWQVATEQFFWFSWYGDLFNENTHIATLWPCKLTCTSKWLGAGQMLPETTDECQILCHKLVEGILELK